MLDTKASTQKQIEDLEHECNGLVFRRATKAAVDAAKLLSGAATKAREQECGKVGDNCRERQDAQATALAALTKAQENKAATDRFDEIETELKRLRSKKPEGDVVSADPRATVEDHRRMGGDADGCGRSGSLSVSTYCRRAHAFSTSQSAWLASSAHGTIRFSLRSCRCWPLLPAGNRVMLKPSELTPRTADLISDLLARLFAPDKVATVSGGADVGAAFSHLPFDHLFYTGSTSVGRKGHAGGRGEFDAVHARTGWKVPLYRGR